EPFTLKSRIIFLSRIIRGWLQAIEQFPYLKSFIKTQVSYMKDSRNGVIYADLKEWQKQNQKISEQTLLAIFQLWSKVYLTGVEEFKKRRFDCSWDDVPGTK
ncbi:hypothetical protein L6272_00825, partial [Microgenomates group bacterium]|nr:hypothetical protein [Microgenomates group bacterium]